MNFFKENTQNSLDKHYNPTSCRSLEAFNVIKHRVLCPFSKGATLWGANDWHSNRTLEENVKTIVTESFQEFTQRSKSLELDAYVLHVPKGYADNTLQLSELLRRILNQLSLEIDGHANFLQPGAVKDPEWHYTCGQETFFIAVFAALYGRYKSRSTQGQEGVFILFQPMHSFQRNFMKKYEDKDTIRSKIRYKFNHGNIPYVRDDIHGVHQEVIRYIEPLSEAHTPVDWTKKHFFVRFPNDPIVPNIKEIADTDHHDLSLLITFFLGIGLFMSECFIDMPGNTWMVAYNLLFYSLSHLFLMQNPTKRGKQCKNISNALSLASLLSLGMDSPWSINTGSMSTLANLGNTLFSCYESMISRPSNIQCYKGH